MNQEEKSNYIKYRLETAFKTLRAAEILAENQLWNSSINRLYYAAFYAINALLVLHNYQTKSHSATKSLFSMHFIKTGILDIKYGKLFSQLFDHRQKGDYDSIFEYDSERVLPLFEPVKELIQTIKTEINKSI
jgi:uncharacterized protein